MTNEHQLPQLIDSGYTVAEMARKFNVARQTIRVWAKKLSPALQERLRANGRLAQKVSNRKWNTAYGPNIRKTVCDLSVDHSSVGSCH